MFYIEYNMAIKLKPLVRGMTLGLLLFAGLYGNIVAHEMGHWLVASELDLNPKMHLFEAPETGTRSFFNQNFFTTYNSGSVQHDVLVAAAGPMINLALALGLAVVYMKLPKKRKYARLVVLMLLIPAILSFVANIIPTAGSDGSVLIQNWR
jgi:membrane-associated protease RseP (regulator of RpoE activity)